MKDTYTIAITFTRSIEDDVSIILGREPHLNSAEIKQRAIELIKGELAEATEDGAHLCCHEVTEVKGLGEPRPTAVLHVHPRVHPRVRQSPHVFIRSGVGVTRQQ